MPRPFPVGRWNVGRPVPRSHPYKAPYYIPTDAFQMLPRWELDDDGGYLRETEDMVRDEDYGLHCSSSNTTLGCIRITKEKDLLWMVEKINRTLDTGEKVYLEVAA
ncbi:hypothetical protein [Sediminispirochaeta smaragdinae]|nr:hypothetical protein [Sediminispirochaeta smaragdinae]